MNTCEVKVYVIITDFRSACFWNKKNLIKKATKNAIGLLKNKTINDSAEKETTGNSSVQVIFVFLIVICSNILLVKLSVKLLVNNY